VVRTRFDLAYLWPLPSLARFSPRFVHLPYTSMPVSDVFALVPRALAPAYFEADKGCSDPELGDDAFQRGAGPTEELLVRALLPPFPSLAPCPSPVRACVCACDIAAMRA